MTGKIGKLLRSYFTNISPDLREDFGKYCAEKNNFRYSILPVFNILTQISCFFIYLYIYPATFPDRPQLDPLAFTIFSVAYILVNVVFCTLFFRVRKKRNHPNYVKWSNILLIVFLFFYVASESFETILEVEISGNIYRFLATFFMVAFLPILSRKFKMGFLVLYTILVEIGFSVLYSQGYASNNRFEELIILFLFACIIIANIVYNGVVRTFELQHSLISVNDELREANEKLGRLAVIDPLTQISNRRAFDQYMALAWRSAYEDGRSLSIIMIDVDDFKIYNDTYGHQKGDECLAAIAQCISSKFQRESDMVARYGGEEFIALSVQNDIKHVYHLADSLRQSVEELQIVNRNGRNDKVVTISLGVASMVPNKQVRFEDLIKMADDALYAAKEYGKNQVCVSLSGGIKKLDELA